MLSVNRVFFLLCSALVPHLPSVGVSAVMASESVAASLCVCVRVCVCVGVCVCVLIG